MEQSPVNVTFTFTFDLKPRPSKHQQRFNSCPPFENNTERQISMAIPQASLITMSLVDEPLINKNKSLQDYYASLESRIGYRLVLGGTRHFGFYSHDTYWPFPINAALRAMEDHLIATLSLEKGSKILDAGCGVGHVAIHLANQGYNVHGIDVVDHHFVKARRNIKSQGLERNVTITKGDYHHLNAFADSSFDGAYTMETFVHATDP